MEIFSFAVFSTAATKLISAFAVKTAVVTAASTATVSTTGGAIATGVSVTAVTVGGVGLAATASSGATMAKTTVGVTTSTSTTTGILRTMTDKITSIFSNLGTTDVVEIAAGAVVGVAVTKMVTGNTIAELKKQLEDVRKRILNNQALLDQLKKELTDITTKEKENAKKAKILEANNRELLEKAKLFDQLAIKQARSLKNMEKLNLKINAGEKENLTESKEAGEELTKLNEKATKLEIQLVTSKKEILNLHTQMKQLLLMTDSLLLDNADLRYST